MSRYRGPKLKIIRRLGRLPGLTSKISKKKAPPGQHGPAKLNKKPSLSEYRIRLQEKQKLRFNYGISEKQLYSYIKEARRLEGATGKNLLKLLEMRLDNIIYRLGMTKTIPSARQFVTHGHVLVNGKKVNIPSFQCQIDDIITIKNKSQSTKLVKNVIKEIVPNNLLGNYLDFDKNKLIGKVKNLVTREDILLNLNELLIVEFYSRK